MWKSYRDLAQVKDPGELRLGFALESQLLVNTRKSGGQNPFYDLMPVSYESPVKKKPPPRAKHDKREAGET